MRLQIHELQQADDRRDRPVGGQSAARAARSSSPQACFTDAKGTLRWHSTIDAALAVLLMAPLGPIAICGCASGAFGHAAACWSDWRLALLHSVLSFGNVVVRGCLVPLTSDNFLFACSSVVLAAVSLHLSVLGLSYTRLIWCACTYDGGCAGHDLSHPNTRSLRRASSGCALRLHYPSTTLLSRHHGGQLRRARSRRSLSARPRPPPVTQGIPHSVRPALQTPEGALWRLRPLSLMSLSPAASTLP